MSVKEKQANPEEASRLGRGKKLIQKKETFFASRGGLSLEKGEKIGWRARAM